MKGRKSVEIWVDWKKTRSIVSIHLCQCKHYLCHLDFIGFRYGTYKIICAIWIKENVVVNVPQIMNSLQPKLQPCILCCLNTYEINYAGNWEAFKTLTFSVPQTNFYQDISLGLYLFVGFFSSGKNKLIFCIHYSNKVL